MEQAIELLKEELIKTHNLRDAMRNNKNPDMIEFGRLIFKCNNLDKAISSIESILEYNEATKNMKELVRKDG